MKRAELKQLAAALADEVNNKPFEHWAAQEYPITWEQVSQGHSIQVEIVRLESTDDFIHLTILVDDGGWSAFVPATADAIVNKAK